MATVRTLLNNALYLSTDDREFFPVEPSGSSINAALDRFVDLLSSYEYIVPYWDTKTLNGESELQNVNMSSINYLQYVLGNVLYLMKEVTQKKFSTLNTIENLKAIPQIYFHDKQNNRIRVYPEPSNSGNRFIVGFIPELTVSNLDMELPSSITKFVKLFFEYELAKGLSDIYARNWSAQKENSRMTYYEKCLQNKDSELTPDEKEMLTAPKSNIPWLSYSLGNVPGN